MCRKSLLSLSLCTFCFATSSARADLLEYVKKPELAYAWTLKEKKVVADGTIYDLQLVSQTWQGIKWEHQLQVYQPKDAKPNGTMLLWNTGGGASPLAGTLGMEFARRVKAPVAFLFHIPNQPLLEGKKEDALIAETFVRYLATKDETWPLLFPMVKSVVKAMDALQDFSKNEWGKPVEKFIISGASKRGWTSWLTAATGDPRVKAIIPLVIDTLNMQKQLPYQLESFGAYSDMIGDYIRAKLVPLPDTADARRLWGMVDPWVYRAKLTMPKLLIMGNNDPYWTTDALNLYWDDIPGDNWVLYVPNAGHNLRQQEKLGPLDQYAYMINGVTAFVRHVTIDNPMPKVKWKHDEAEGKLRLTVEASEPPKAARLWVAHAPTRDFRQAKWVEHKAAFAKDRVIGEITPPAEGCVAFFAELEFEMEGNRYQLSTQLRIAGTPKK